MCNPFHARRLATAFLCAVAWTQAAVAQSSTPSSDRIASRERAVATALIEYNNAIARAREDSTRRAQLPIVRHYAGAVVRSDTTRFPSDFFGIADSAFSAATQAARVWFGNAVDTLLRGRVTAVTPRYQKQATLDTGLPAEFAIFDGVLGRSSPVSVARKDAEQLKIVFADWISRGAREHIPLALAKWSGPELAVYPHVAVTRRSAYINLASGRFAIGRTCIDGAIAACRAALAIAPRNDTLAAWFDAMTQRMIVRTSTQHVFRDGYDFKTLRRECVERGSDSACTRAILSGIGVASPTGRDAREDLLRRALVQGGPDAYGRMVALGSNDDVGASLERIARVPLDSLIVAWRRDVIAERTPSPAPNPTELLAGILITAIAVGASARRQP